MSLYHFPQKGKKHSSSSSILQSSRLILLLILVLLLGTARAANAFAPTSFVRSTKSTSTTSVNKLQQQQQRQVVTLSPRGGSQTSTKMSSKAAETKIKKVRINAFDSMRFFLIAFICIGHFIRFADPADAVMKFFSQVNVVVGAFFILSGYVAAYTSTDVASYESSPKLGNASGWIVPRIFGYFPLHLVCLILFSPVFLYADVSYNGWPIALAHGLMSVTMIQAWFPMHAEVWNAPTWFLSALTFATAILPFSIPKIAKMNKKQLRNTTLYLSIASLLPKLGYCYDHNAWGVMEGMLSPKAFDNLAIFNTQRFNPFFATIEVLLGVVTCRLVMLDDAVDNDNITEKKPQVNVLSTLLPLMGMVGVLVARALDVLPLNDMLTRSLIFLPLFMKFLMAAHRASVKDPTGKNVTDPVVNFLSSKLLTTLGGLAFPIFIVHGPIGQIFYKKIIAKKLFGGTLNTLYGPNMFYGYLAAVVVSAAILKALVLDNKAVGTWSKNTAAKLSAKL